VITSPFHSSRSGKTVRLVALHTAEGSRTVESLGRWFQRRPTEKDPGSSSHTGIDDFRIETYVAYDRAAWTLRSGNKISDNAELCGFARWSRAEWLTHDQMLTLAAQWVRERCAARNIPLRKLTPAQVAAGVSGVIGHKDWTVGMHDGTHTDPGDNFPWDVVIARARNQEDDMPSADEVAKAVWDQARKNGFGDTVSAWQVVSASDARTAALQAQVNNLQAQMNKLAADVAAIKSKP
jgi:hypothetical protein